jgi:hypothetical protein
VPDVRAPGASGWDALIEKRIAFTERMGLDFGTEMFNAANAVNSAGPQTTTTSGDSGKIRLWQTDPPRQIQFGPRLSF